MASESPEVLSTGMRCHFTSGKYGGSERDGQECETLDTYGGDWWEVRFDDGEHWIARADELVPPTIKPGLIVRPESSGLSSPSSRPEEDA
jgi:hypothetical protein